jgi:hypothetical protein
MYWKNLTEKKPQGILRRYQFSPSHFDTRETARICKKQTFPEEWLKSQSSHREKMYLDLSHQMKV